MSDKSDESAGEKPVARKSYSPPVLVQWGTLRDITKAVGASGNNDGGTGKQPRRTR